MAQSVDAAYNDLAGLYDPQTNLLNQQITQAGTTATAQLSSLDQAKVNAFRDIETSANRKGMLFSGFSPENQAQYLGTKYLPAVANVKNTLLNNQNTLNAKISQLNAQRRIDAQNTVAAQTKAEQEAAYRQQQLDLSYARLQVASRRGSGGLTPYQQITLQNQMAGQYKAVGKGWGTDKTSSTGGWNFSGPKGPVSMAQYLDAKGAGPTDLFNLLANGSSYDRNIYNKVKNITDQNALKNALIKYDTANYYGFR